MRFLIRVRRRQHIFGPNPNNGIKLLHRVATVAKCPSSAAFSSNSALSERNDRATVVPTVFLSMSIDETFGKQLPQAVNVRVTVTLTHNDLSLELHLTRSRQATLSLQQMNYDTW